MTSPPRGPFAVHAQRLASTLIPGESLPTEVSRLADAMAQHIGHDLNAALVDHDTIRQTLIDHATEIAAQHDDSTRQSVTEWRSERIAEIWDDYMAVS